ncbi:hypothetical protein ACHAXA_001934 [Cyclostephanos tholiformis]|uniref:Uncharacterized protein n=1 Tax=Cyclostephanos tholiformis TaxID=382380 RepID=A0ABD3RSF2_9STRA
MRKGTSLTIAAIAGVAAGFVPPSSRVLVPPATATSSSSRRHDHAPRSLLRSTKTSSTTSSDPDTEYATTATDDAILDRDILSSPPPDDWRSQVLSALSAVIDPDLNADIVTLGFVKNLMVDPITSVVSLDLELTTPACPVKDMFVEQCRDLIDGLDWTPGGRSSAMITLTSRPADVTGPGTPSGMSRVGAVVAVSSCKGGVGKSTTAVNLAFALHRMGAKVGIFDADVYGPSLPTMVVPDDDRVRFIGRQIAPLTRGGVSLMSFGYVNEGSAVMRGPMVTQLLDQFLSLTQWGELDYLILDMPPGTGDIQLTLTQKLNITAAVIVTTPQELSFVDVERGVQMFDTVNVPCVAVVENMAYLERGKETVLGDESSLREQFANALLRAERLVGDERAVAEVAKDLVEIVRANLRSNNADGSGEGTEQIRIFGPGHKRRLSEQWGIEHSYSIPLMGKIAQNGDSGTPFILDNPTSPQAEIYMQLARSVVSEVSKAKYGKGKGGDRPNVTYVSEMHAIQVVEGGRESMISPAELRRGCRCAACIEELTGRQILNPASVPESIQPLSMSRTGNYALSVDWSDGHRSLYPYRQIRSIINDAGGGGRDVVDV